MVLTINYTFEIHPDRYVAPKLFIPKADIYKVPITKIITENTQ